MPPPEQLSRNNPFGLGVHLLAERAMHKPLASIVRHIIFQADLDGLSIAKADVVKSYLKGSEMDEHRHIVYLPSYDTIHMMIPRRSGIGRA